jgi:hypothetical protein
MKREGNTIRPYNYLCLGAFVVVPAEEVVSGLSVAPRKRTHF